MSIVRVPSLLSADTEPFDYGFVSVYFPALEVVQKASSLADKFQQPPTAVMILFVYLEMLGQVCDTLGQNGDLDLGRTGITVMLFK